MKIILASKSGVRKAILDNHNIESEVIVSNVDEDQVKDGLLAEGATPLIVSKNLAELKSIKVSSKYPDRLVLGADSVISLNDHLINKPKSREEAFKILKELSLWHGQLIWIKVVGLHFPPVSFDLFLDRKI